MSTTVDQRVVQMEFDNSRFERNVSTTMSTLDKLKQSLNLTGAAKGLESVGTAAKGINLSGLATAADTVTTRFSYMQATIQHQLNNIVDSAVNAGKRITSALTIDPIKQGFSEYETQINAIQTILANTESKGTTLDDVNTALDTLNEYADKTIYNFTQMTKNIGTFTAAGVDLDTSVKSIQGIANLAAVSGSTSQQASTAMYQLSQALAAGRVSLMDWNSVVNAGMGGQVFQDALKRTSEMLGTGAEAAIKKYGSFRESLTKGEWLTTEVLTKTLEQFTMAAEEGSEQWEAYKKSLMDEGYTEKQALEILKMANTATNAATKVKTFTQLWDTLKESAQSGWTQTWEILVGDFEEAKEMLTKVSDVIGNIINESAKARNELLQGWKDDGGRDDLINGITFAFEGLMNIIKPIKQAFRDVFPPLTVKNLVTLTQSFEILTAKFKAFTEKHGDKFYSTFKGIFSVLDIGWTIVKDLAGGIAELVSSFTGVGGNILDATGSLGDWLSSLRDSFKETDVFGKAVDNVVKFLTLAIDKVKEFGGSVKEHFSTPEVEGFLGIFESLWEIIKQIGSSAGTFLSNVGSGIADIWGGTDLFDTLASLFSTGIFAGIAKFVWGLGDIFDDVGGFMENITGILDDVRGCFEAYQNNLKADTLSKIATAIGILAASIFVLAMIDGDALDRSIGAITILFTELLAALAIFGKIDVGMKGVGKAIGLMIGMSVSLLILAGALKAISTIGWEGLAKSLLGVGALMLELAGFLFVVNKIGGGKSVKGLIPLALSLLIFTKVMEAFGNMNSDELTKGLAAIGGLLTELAAFTLAAGYAKHITTTGISLIFIAAAMKILASAMKDFGGMEWSEIGKGLTAMGGALAEISAAMMLMPATSILNGIGLIAIAAAMKILASAFSDFGNLEWEDIGKGLASMGGSLAIIAGGLIAMTGTLAGSGALLVAAGALTILVPVLQSLGGMSWGEIGKGLLTLAGAFAVIGLAGLVLGPLVPTILSLAAAFALFGISTLGIGIGLMAIAAGFSALATAGAVGATAFVAGLTVILTGILDLIPTLVSKFGDIIIAVCDVIKECAPKIADTILVVISEVLASLATYTPQIVSSLLEFLIGLLEAVTEHLPELITAAVEFIGAFFEGVVDALSGIDTTSLFKGIIGVGLMAGLMFALSAVSSLIPGAMTGVLGMGAVIAELALVLAAIGALAQIPGLSWLIEEGGDFLQTVGTAIGQFIGGIVGGIAEGATSTLPQIGTNLSDFMTNMEPFISGAQGLSAASFEGVKAMADAILTLTGANLLDAIASFLTGGSSLTRFAEDLVPFGDAMKAYSNKVATVNSAAITNSVTAAQGLVAVAKAIPSDGLFGTDGIDDFGKNAVKFGESLVKYGKKVADINSSAITASLTVAQQLMTLTNSIPDDGALGTDGIDNFGDNIESFGKSLKKYSDKVADISFSAIMDSILAVRSLMNLINSMAGVNTDGVETFKDALNSLSRLNIDGFVNTFSKINSEMTSAGSNLVEALVKGIDTKRLDLITAANTLSKTITDRMSSQNTEFITAGSEIMNRFMSGITKKEFSVVLSVNTLISKVATAVKNQYGTFHNAGRYLVEGFAAGIQANRFKAEAAASAMARAAKLAAERTLGIASPSKEFYEVGDYSGQGFVNALGDFASKAYSAGSNMAESAKSGLASAISKVNDLLNGDMDTQPTIRPVLDLSDIQSRASMIDSLLNMRPSVGVLANVGALSNMMNNRQNGGNDDVVSAINKLRKDLANFGGNSYSIGNLSYNDDSAVGDAIAALVRAVIVEGRV